MSAIIVLPILIPAGAAAWPAIAAAAAAAASVMGFAGASTRQDTEEMTEVELPVSSSESVAEDMALGEELVFTKDYVQVAFFRNAQGQVSLKVRGRGKTEGELRALGQQLADGLTQQYAYHRLVTELKRRNFNVVGEEVEQDGTVRLQVRTFQG